MKYQDVKYQLQSLCNTLKLALQRELVSQGHNATGKLVESIDVFVNEMIAPITIYGMFAYYGPYVDYGRNIGVKRVPIDVLLGWIKIKNFDLKGNSARSVAFALQTAIFKKGIPSNGASNKKRFMSKVLEAREQEIFDRINHAFGNIIEAEIFNVVELTQTSINSIQYGK
jgi:hypothetical protein